ncbi:MAG: tyrosine-type recombinase/integrase [Rubrivivax sp.]
MSATPGLARIGLPHFAHLRAVAQGADPVASAQRYLLADSRHQALQLHRATVDRMRDLARRHAAKDWRLAGLQIQAVEEHTPPSLEDWVAAEGLDGWSQAEQLELYEQAHPVSRKQRRNARLMSRQLQLLKSLEAAEQHAARASDRIDDWLDRRTASRLMASGLLLLQDLQAAIARRAQWWSALPGIGATKAARIQAYLAALGLQPAPPPRRPWALAPVPAPSPGQPLPDLRGAVGPNRGTPVLLQAADDPAAIDAWIKARQVKALTERSYRKELRRLHLWALLERGKALSALTAEDCAAYVAFLSDVPPTWIGASAPLGSARWTPFAGQLSASSRRQALVICQSCFDWMCRAGYIRENPWELVGTRVADDARSVDALVATRAFSPKAWDAIEAWLRRDHATRPAHARTRFMILFCGSTGVRIRELIAATLGDLQHSHDAIVLKVIGKGGKARAVVLAGSARAVLDEYLVSQDLPPLLEVIGNAEVAALPVLPGVGPDAQPGRAASYSTIYKRMKAALLLAIAESSLGQADREQALAASPHWLRHTFGTRAKERGVSDDVLMEQLGHADLRSCSRYTRSRLHRRQEQLEAVFGSA